MEKRTRYLSARDGLNIFTRIWAKKNGEPSKGVIHILHGMAEHSFRYQRFAKNLVASGYAVVAHDHRGHGETGKKSGIKGFWGNVSGWDAVIDDVFQVNSWISKQFPKQKICLFGHSMGSFIAQGYALKYPNSISGVILSGSNYDIPAKLKIARLIALFETYRQGKQKYSPVIHFLSFSKFNRQFTPTRTNYDWLSRDEKEVDRYIDDNECGFRCSNQLWVDLLGGMASIFSQDFPASLEKVPFYILAGEEDPVGGQLGNEKLKEFLAHKGVEEIKIKVFPRARHEILNETNRKEVELAIISWLQDSFLRK